MTMAVADVPELARDLVAVLDEEIALEESVVGQLEKLSEAVLGRERSAIESLVDDAMETHTRFEAAESRRRAACAALAAALGGPAGGRLTLARLVRALPATAADERWAIDDRRRRLEQLVVRVRRQHIRTAVHLQECARVNEALLVRLFPQMESANVYGSSGETNGRRGGSLVDARS